MADEKVLFTEDFQIVPQGASVSNIPNVWSTAYQVVVPKRLVYCIPSSSTKWYEICT